MTSSKVRMKGRMSLSKLMPSTFGCFRCSLMVSAQCLVNSFLHKIAKSSVILLPNAIFISFSLACVRASISSFAYWRMGFWKYIST